MNIRLEIPADCREVENLTREAFWNIYRPGCTEHFVLNQYRKNPDFMPQLDFVMEEGTEIIGHVMFSKAVIQKEGGGSLSAWTFGPISIRPDYQRKGYGLKLLKYALEKAKEAGVAVVCMEGKIDFYKHAGLFSPVHWVSITTASRKTATCLISSPRNWCLDTLIP